MSIFSIQSRDWSSHARAGQIETPHGTILTPAFIPVATKATVKAVMTETLRDTIGAQALLANTYHLFLQPGSDLIKKAGGLHQFMNWPGPTFTDSGGFQAFSLGGNKGRNSKIAKDYVDYHNETAIAADTEPEMTETVPMAAVSDDGVSFKSIIDGSSHVFTPESSIEIQHAIGADIIFTFDECLLPAEPYERQKQAVERTAAWGERCLKRHKELPMPRPALLGIVQGGRHEDLRKMSAKAAAAMDLDGFGIGGSFDKEDIGTAVGWVTSELPEEKPRHLLGIGSEPVDLILGVENGIDTFDCVAPTRMARNGSVYVSGNGRINLMNAEFVSDFRPIDALCACHVCKRYTRAYISHLFRAKEMLAATLATIHNLFFVIDLVRRLRQAIISGRFAEEKMALLSVKKV